MSKNADKSESLDQFSSFHFSQMKRGNTPSRLLRAIAKSIDEHGPNMDVIDITFHAEGAYPHDEYTMTVYYGYRGDSEDDD